MINVILQFLELDLVNINVSAKFYQNIPNGLRVKFHCFQNLNLGKTSTNPKCHFTISCATSCQYQRVRKASTDDKCHFAIVSLVSKFEPWQKLNQSQVPFDNLTGYILSISMCTQNFITIFDSVQEIGPFSLFIWSSAKPRPMKNVISQSLGLDLVNINDYTKVYQNYPLSSRDRAIFTFSEFESRQRLGQSQVTFENPLGCILSISMHMQNFIKTLQTV